MSAQDGLYKISYPDGEIDTLRGPGQYYWPAWSPDGSKIACVWRAASSPDTNGIYVMNSDGTDYRLIIPYSDFPAWIHDDSLLYLNYNTDFPYSSICLSDSAGDSKRLVRDKATLEASSIGQIRGDIYSKKIVFRPSIEGEGITVWKDSLDQLNASRFLDLAQYPNFSHHGDSVIFTNYSYGFGNLWIIAWNGTGLRQITPRIDGGDD